MRTVKYRRITATEFGQRRGYFMKQASVHPIIITKLGKDWLVLCDYDFYCSLERPIK